MIRCSSLVAASSTYLWQTLLPAGWDSATVSLTDTPRSTWSTSGASCRTGSMRSIGTRRRSLDGLRPSLRNRSRLSGHAIALGNWHVPLVDPSSVMTISARLVLADRAAVEEDRRAGVVRAGAVPARECAASASRRRNRKPSEEGPRERQAPEASVKFQRVHGRRDSLREDGAFSGSAMMRPATRSHPSTSRAPSKRGKSK